MHKLYDLKEMLCKELEEFADRDKLTATSLESIDKLAHAAKNVSKLIEMCDDKYSSRPYERGMSRDGYSRDGYYYDDGMSHRRGRGADGRFVSRDGSEMAHKLREMMHDAPDDMRHEIQRLADRMENM